MAPDTRDNVPCFAELPLQAVPAAAEAQSLVYSGSEAEVSYEVAQPVSGRSVAADPDLSLGTSSLVVTPEASQPAECASSTGAGGGRWEVNKALARWTPRLAPSTSAPQRARRKRRVTDGSLRVGVRGCAVSLHGRRSEVLHYQWLCHDAACGAFAGQRSWPHSGHKEQEATRG